MSAFLLSTIVSIPRFRVIFDNNVIKNHTFNSRFVEKMPPLVSTFEWLKRDRIVHLHRA
jgi:hypothetical protein